LGCNARPSCKAGAKQTARQTARHKIETDAFFSILNISSAMETEAIFEQRIILNAKDFNNIEKKSINSIILDKLRDTLENKCSKHGFVLPNTLEILSRSLGRVENGRFTGSFIYQVQARGKVLVPVDGAIVKGTILKKNKMGIYVYYRNAFRIIVPRDFHLGNETYEGLKIGDEIEIIIKKSIFQVKDPYIRSVGILTAVSDIINVKEEEEKEEPIVNNTKNIRKNSRKPPIMSPIKEETSANLLEDLTTIKDSGESDTKEIELEEEVKTTTADGWGNNIEFEEVTAD